MKVSELMPPELDYWVARATKQPLSEDWNQGDYILIGSGEGDQMPWRPSRDWSHGGPLIEEHITEVEKDEYSGTCTWPPWVAYPREGDPEELCWRGPTPLIAAMRAIVASKYGEEVGDDTDA